MANAPGKPKDNGRIKLPTVDGGMNKISPNIPNDDGKGALRKSAAKARKRPVRAADAPPAYSETNAAAPEEDNDEKSIVLGQRKEDQDQEEGDEVILDRMRKRFTRAVSAEDQNRRAGKDDLEFKAAKQWPEDVATQRNTDRRPCLTINKIPTFINQVTNDQRQNRPAINVSPVGEIGDADAAKMFRGMIRAIERDSSADIAYDTAFDCAVSMGWGYWRILIEPEGPKSFDEKLRIARIRNPFTVYRDPDRQEPDGSDSMWDFITDMIPRDEYKRQYPWADEMPFTGQSTGDSYKDWSTKDTVRIAEYFEVVITTRKLVELENGHIGWEDELSDGVKAKIKSKRILVLRERDSECRQVKWYKVNGKQILERTDWPGEWIPIIQVIGNEIDIEGKLILSGLIRDAKDPQRVYNYSVTSEMEIVALAPRAPYIMEEGQAEGWETQWKQANVKNYPVLFYKGTSVAGKPAPPPQRQQMVGSPVGWINMKMSAAQDMMAVTGIRFDPTNADNRVDDSGVAIRELRRSGDMGSFHYMDNLGRSLKFAGDQYIDLIIKIYTAKQIRRILREDGADERIMIDPTAPQAYKEVMQPDGKKLKIFNPSLGKYAVTVTLGPSFATKRIEAAESMMSFAKALPQTAALIADLIAKNQDWPGAEEMAARLAKAVPTQLLTPDQKDISPQLQAVMQNMEAQIKQLSEQLQGAMAALNNEDKDRAVALEKIHTDFTAKMAAIAQKAESDFQKHIGSTVADLSRDVQKFTALMEGLSKKTDDASEPTDLHI